MVPRHVKTTINYYKDPGDGTKHAPSIAGMRSTFTQPSIDIETVITDITTNEDTYTLDSHGFQLFYHTSQEKDFVDDQRIRQIYYPEVEQLLMTTTGATRVFIFDHTIRRPNPTAKSSDDERRPVKRAHIDQSERASMNQVKRHLGAEAPRLLQSRFQVINVWRPIKTIYKDPLAVCDSHSVDDADILPIKLIYPDWVGEPCTILPSKNHRWYFKRNQTPNEVMMIKCYEWKLDGRARRVPHAAFTDPKTIDHEPRHSIERNLGLSTAVMSPQLLAEKISLVDADLRVISLQKLLNGDLSSRRSLLQACTDLGFFYLDCQDIFSGQVMQDVQNMYEMATSFYDLPQEEKSAWLVDRDHDEKLVMGLVLLAEISKALGLQGDLALQSYHRKHAVCPTALGLLKYTLAEIEPDKVGQIAHSDAGSLSIVFTEVAGLQVLKPNEETWYYIAPKPGHAVVNIGDALRFISGGVLESSLHRIIPHKDELGRHKYSIVYLLRPEMEAEFTDAEGVIWKGLEWTNKKHAVFRASAEEQAKGTYLTGREGFVGYWDPENDVESQTITVA
ncbi:2-oxoglutarate-dependent dioxygenase gloE [Colletotrichum trifolii]|uniref:2-oxoglutarate-dependent dioxygenase gloE n=1 Tax=Colletotrichum trifolii TaxID=5466 RepID=A0A4R8RMC0_COLTR|nr:2-oxoglutarate-dependent dioxygenase gloE [Colletotrichum trifolii]